MIQKGAETSKGRAWGRRNKQQKINSTVTETMPAVDALIPIALIRIYIKFR